MLQSRAAERGYILKLASKKKVNLVLIELLEWDWGDSIEKE